MKVATYQDHGSPEALHVADWPEPDLPSGEVMVRVEAVALNGFDPMMLAGSTGLKVPMPMVPCGDFAGRVCALGSQVDTPLKVGDPVTGFPMVPDRGMLGEVTLGAARELINMPPDCLIPIPDGVTMTDAAALPVAYGTALRMMETRGKISRDERVLVLGATGGVGVACIQLAKAAGAFVVACGRGSKAAGLTAVGADDVIDTAQDDFFIAARERYGKPSYDGSGDGGFDVVVNYIGGDTWAPSLKLLRRHGRALVCGATAGFKPETDLRYLWSFEQHLIGSNGWTPEDQQELLRRVAAGTLTPVVHQIRPIEKISDAFQELIDREVFGKSVLTL
ncbi:MAG: zinc-binding dehydrogenase [Pseudomonadota bacterium]